MKVRKTLFRTTILLLGFAFYAGFALPVKADVTQDLKDAYQLISDGKFTDALTKYQAILTNASLSDVRSKCHFWMGIAYEATNQEDKAISSFETLVTTSDYRWAEALHKLAVHYRAKGDKAKSDAFIQQLIDRRKTAIDPKEKLRADLLIGDSLKLKGDWEKALQHYQSIKPLYSEVEYAQDILYHIANCAHHAERTDEALQAYQDYMRQYPTNPRTEEVAFKIVEVYRDAKRFQAGIDYLNKLIVSYPKLRTKALVSQLELFTELHDEANWSSLAQQILDENSDPYQVYLVKCRLAFNYLYHTKEPLRARALFEEALEAYPKDNLAVEMAAFYAATFSATGDHRRAAELYAEALKKYDCPVAEWEAWILYMSGHEYMLADDKAAAKQTWDVLVKKHSENTWADSAKREAGRWSK